MADFVEVARLDEVPPRASAVVSVAGKNVALFNVDGTIYAMEDACPHQGSSLGSSELNGKIVSCRAHGWRYDVTTGSTLHVPGFGVPTYPVKVEDGQVMIVVP
jgi:nitrite reductase/ring-hydroxylating ferredoxin subunit